MQKGDEVVTQDYGLEAMCLARGARALNREGMEYTGDNIDACCWRGTLLRKFAMTVVGTRDHFHSASRCKP